MKSFLVDLDGTIHRGDQLIDGAKEAIEYLRTKGKVFFCTNKSNKSSLALSKELKELGIEASGKEIITTYDMLLNMLKKENKKVFPIVSDKAKEQLIKSGIKISEEADIVVVGYSTTSTYEDYDTVYRLIGKGAKFIAMHKLMTFPDSDGDHIGPGFFVNTLEEITGKKSIILGKPSANFFAAAMKKFGTSKNNTYMIGDDLPADINGAKNFGLKTIFVETGTHKRKDLKKYESKPDYVLKSIKDIASLSL